MKNLLKRFIREVLSSPSGNVRGTSTVRTDDGSHLGQCPECGAESGVNIDCPTCMLAEHRLTSRKPRHVWRVLDENGVKDCHERQAACVLVWHPDGNQVLAVSRKDNPGDFGLPGGKVDPGETPLDAAQRELREETGLIASNLKLVFVATDGEFVTYTYVGTINGEVDTNEAGVVKWVTPDVLLRGSFADYNERLFTRLTKPRFRIEV